MILGNDRRASLSPRLVCQSFQSPEDLILENLALRQQLLALHARWSAGSEGRQVLPGRISGRDRRAGMSRPISRETLFLAVIQGLRPAKVHEKPHLAITSFQWVSLVFRRCWTIQLLVRWGVTLKWTICRRSCLIIKKQYSSWSVTDR